MSTITDIADAVAARLNAGTFSMPFTAVRRYQPVYALDELATLRVSVVPRSLAIVGASRQTSQVDAQIDIGVQKRLSSSPASPASDEAEIDALLGLVEEIADWMRFARLPTTPEAVWVGVAQEPVVAGEHLEQHRQFTSILTVTYRMLR
ncbi:MAG: hypothetical protein KF724_12130 [Phycisphaeraceae bacterium]|nr:hypothetical protein [Phycisphaeraceae bacterium]